MNQQGTPEPGVWLSVIVPTLNEEASIVETLAPCNLIEIITLAWKSFYLMVAARMALWLAQKTGLTILSVHCRVVLDK